MAWLVPRGDTLAPVRAGYGTGTKGLYEPGLKPGSALVKRYAPKANSASYIFISIFMCFATQPYVD